MTTAWIEDDSDVIDAIESAKADWFEAHSECDIPTSETTDEEINKSLGLNPSGALRPLADEFADWTQGQVREAVANGLSVWFEEAKRSAPDFNDVLDGAAHIIADGECLRAGNPALFVDDPDVESEIVVDVYPEPGMPNHSTIMRLGTGTDRPDAEVLETALRERFVNVFAAWDDA